MGSGVAKFEAFDDGHFSPVCRALTVALHDAQLAEDSAQEAFTRAFVYWRRVSRMDRPAAWVYVVAVRVAYKRRSRAATPGAVTATVDIAQAVVDRASLRAAIDALPERQRLAVVLRYHADLPLASVADAMGCALGTVKSTLHSALQRLQVELTEAPEEVSRDALG
jgi:RNA polymerase sigma factor (sigma-70 family)